MKRTFICLVCPNSCRVDVEYTDQEIQTLHGVECPRGREFVMNEIRHPRRVFTGSVRVNHGDCPVVSVKTPQPVPKHLLRELGQLTHRLQVDAPVVIGQTVAAKLLADEIEFVATRTVERKR